jgi:beta-phosphoglucomutase-like phosphatase (HAD superfamily)
MRIQKGAVRRSTKPIRVTQAKQAPDIYHVAVATLMTPPERYPAIEDLPIGMESDLSAGMRCMVIPSRHLIGADFSGAYAMLVSFPALQC